MVDSNRTCTFSNCYNLKEGDLAVEAVLYIVDFVEQKYSSSDTIRSVDGHRRRLRW